MSRGYYGSGAPFLYTAPDSGSPALGMDCLQLRSPTAPGPFHYLINEHSKSLIALQELQHEVGALLEFRDLVIETFPNLRTKLASSTPATMTTSITQHSSNIPVAVKHWEPGVRVRRKLGQSHKDSDHHGSSSFGRSRSNSHSGKQQPKSGDGISVVQDSGFSTETSSSKETPSASSSTAPGTSTAPVIEQNEAEDELWNLLDIIHRKGTRLKDEVEALQGMLREQSMDEDEDEPCDFQRSLLHASVDDVRQLRRERDVLLDRVAEMEAEMLAGRVHTSRLQGDLEALLAAKQDLEEQLRTVITQKSELNNRIHDMHMQFVSKSASAPSSPETTKPPTPTKRESLNNKRTPVRRNSGSLPGKPTNLSTESLDVVLGTRLPKIRTPDSKRIAAILLEHDPVMLQKHLLSTSVQNQLLQQRLELIIRAKNSISEKLDKTKEENEDLRFQLEDRNIELEGTRARVRLLEQLQLNKPLDHSPDIIPVGIESVQQHQHQQQQEQQMSRSEITTASMKAMSPLPLNLQMDHSSSTESAHDQSEQNRKDNRRRPSKIPLPGVKSYAAPKPPIGKQSSSPSGGSGSGARSRSGGSPGRPGSAHSWRNKSEGNSLSASAKGSVHSRGRDSLTGKLRSNDSLSKHRDSLIVNNSANSFGSSNTTTTAAAMKSAGGGSVGKRGDSSISSAGGVQGGHRRVGSSSSRNGGGRESPDTKIYTSSISSVNSSSSPWVPSSFNSDIELELCPDSLDVVRHQTQSQTQAHTFSSSSHMFQTANMFFWNTSPTSEYFDSIDSASVNLNNSSMMDSSFYQSNGEGEALADCDSLEEKKFSIGRHTIK